MNKTKLLELIKEDIDEDAIQSAEWDDGCIYIEIMLGLYDLDDPELCDELKEACNGGGEE